MFFDSGLDASFCGSSIYLATTTRYPVYSCGGEGSLLSFADRNICCIFVVGLNTVCRLCFFKSFPMRSVTPLMYGRNTLFVGGCFSSSFRCCFLGLMALLISFLE